MRSYDSGHQRLLIISPVKDEAESLERTTRSVLAQTRRPAHWVIVDDGSVDATGAIADALAREHPWISVVHRPAGPPGRVGPGAIDAFHLGLRRADVKDYDFIGKIDGGLEFSPEYFATLMRRFVSDPRLGAIGGEAYSPDRGTFVLDRTDDFSQGAATLYRRACFEEIGGLVGAVTWDGLDRDRCRMLGWKATIDPQPAMAVRRLRPPDTSLRGVLRGRVRWGRARHFMGTHPLSLLGIAAYRMLEHPRVLGGLGILWGYLDARLRGRPGHDGAFRRYLHRWQLQELSQQLASRPTPVSLSAPPRPSHQFRFGIRWASRGVGQRPRHSKTRVSRRGRS